MSKALDQFYTNPLIAEKFVNKVLSFIDVNEYDDFIEPSAGTGNILDYMPEGSIGLDLDPKRDDMIEIDFFDYIFPKGKNIVIGNPPFGYKSKLAIEFFNKCALNADVIAFIVPRSWMRYGLHSKLNKDFGLFWNCLLPADSFIFNNKPYNVKCVAQFWSKNPPKYGFGGHETWDDGINIQLVNELDEYQLKNGCYERPTTLF